MPRCTRTRVRQAQRTVSLSHLSVGRPRSVMPNLWAMACSYAVVPSTGSVSGSSVRSRISSFSPRSIASTRCDGSAVNGSAKSK